VGVYLLPGWVRAFRDRFPRLTVELTTGVTADIVKLVLSRQADVGFVEGELDVHQHPRLASAALQAIEQKVVVGRQHALWDTPALRIDDLRGQSFVVRTQNSQSRLWLEEKLREAGITPIIGAAFDNMEAIKRALAAGSCLSILPPYVVEDEVRRGELRTLSVQDLPLHRTLKVIWDQAAHLSPVARAFLREISPNYPPLHDLLAASS
jgi:DNA-binding transcriptional LysR family regulator